MASIHLAAGRHSHAALAADVTTERAIDAPTTTAVHGNTKRGHIRSASLENANSFISKNTLGLPVVDRSAAGTVFSQTGTLKSRNEQKRMRNKFGSHSNLEDYVQPGRSKFQNILRMFEPNRNPFGGDTGGGGEGDGVDKESHRSLPITAVTTAPIPAASGAGARTHQHSRPAFNLHATNLLRPIAFKPIPFEPDYSLPPHYCDAAVVADRYGSTPSLAPVQGSNLRFGSTTDLRHGGSGTNCVVGAGGIIGGYLSSSNYCNSLMARRRGSRSLKINDSMESIRHTPDSDVNSQTSTIKSFSSNNNSKTCNFGHNNSNSTNNHVNANKFALSGGQSDMTPSPSDSGISDLEAALKGRDSELSYLRHTIEHNEKDKDSFWENETRRLKKFCEGQQREYLFKMKKMEQIIAMQQFQLKQHKLKHSEQTNTLREQLSDLKNENEILRCSNNGLKNTERNLKDRAAYIEEQLRESHTTVDRVQALFEESEWKVAERNGEIALLKTQLKEANVELTLKEHAIVHLKHENSNAETQMYQSLQENHKIAEHRKLVEDRTVKNRKDTESELKQLNKIIILKDQVILALTNELTKLRKELSDLAIFHEYGEEPSGKYRRLKQQLDNLTAICNKTRKHMYRPELRDKPQQKVIDDANLEVIINCLKISPPLNDDGDTRAPKVINPEKRLAKVASGIPNFGDDVQNLTDVDYGHLEECTLNTLIKESANYAGEIVKLRQQLDDVRNNFELEKRQWIKEKEKVLSYQKQLQAHYINMYQKIRLLESSNEL